MSVFYASSFGMLLMTRYTAILVTLSKYQLMQTIAEQDRT